MTAAVQFHTLGDIIRRLGDIPPDRVRYRPYPGTATVADVETNKHCELVDGTLVEKAMGWHESLLAGAIIEALRRFVRPRKLGAVTGEQGTMEILTALVRIPDVAFVSWDRFPNRRPVNDPVPAIAPDLAVEVISRGNTPSEMARKRAEYFQAGVRLLWAVDPRSRTVTVYTAPDRSTVLTEADTLDGGDVLPGFAYPLRELFGELDEHG